jgi:serine/threonine protein kinase
LGITAYEMVTGRRPFAEDNAKTLLDMHLTRDVTDPGLIISDIPDELRRFILKSARRDPAQRYQDMEQAMAVLRPIVQTSRSSKSGLVIENKKNSSLFLTYSDENQPELKRLVDEFKAKARELGVDIKMTDTRDS